MKSKPSTTTKQQVLKRVATNLYRSNKTGIYYTIFKRGGKQVKCSLETTNRELAQRRLDNQRAKKGRLFAGNSKKLPFAEYEHNRALIGGLAKDWLDVESATIEPSTRDRHLDNIKQLRRFFGGTPIGRISRKQVEEWARRRAIKSSPRTYNKELSVLQRSLEYGVEHELFLDNPARELQRRTPHNKVIEIPTRKIFFQLLDTMRANGGHRSADLVELLAFSGCRVTEIVDSKKYAKTPMRWRDIDFERKNLTVSRPKNHKPRFVPLFRELKHCLHRLLTELPVPPRPDDRIIPICSAKKSIESACRKLGLPKYGHHTCRHFFCSDMIEAGVDFKTIAEWLGHQDGGVPVAKTYGHLRNEHADLMVERVNNIFLENSKSDDVVPFEAGVRRTQNE